MIPMNKATVEIHIIFHFPLFHRIKLISSFNGFILKLIINYFKYISNSPGKNMIILIIFKILIF